MNLLALSIGAIIGIVAAAVVVIALIIWIIAAHNRFVGLDNQCESAFNNIDVYLKKRYDLIPNIVNTVKGYASHESETLLKVVEARNRAQSASTTREKIEADEELNRSMRAFNLVMERYPELKANANFMDLQNQLKSIETELANSRRYYNATVEQFNKSIKMFPSNIIASCMKLSKKPYFKLDSPEESQNVKVEF